MLEQEKISKIKILLKVHPKGLTITDISSKLKLNRNSVAKYLEILLISGQVESQSYGTARVFFLSHRLPISALVSIASDPVVTLDENHRILFVNDRFCNFFAVEKEDVTGNHIIDVFKAGIGSETLPGIFSDVIADQETVHDIHLTLDSGEFFFKIKSMKTVFDDGSRGITIIMEDVTREKKDQIELEAKEARYRGIVEDQTEFIIRFDPKGTLTFINASYSHYLGKQPEELVRTQFSDSICDGDRSVFNTNIKSLCQENPVTTFECRSTRSPGQVRWIAWTLRALFNGEKIPVEYQAVGQDITEKKEASEKIRQYIAQMEFFSKKLQQFIELPPEDDIYHAVGAGLSEILPRAAISVSSYDPETTTLTVKAVFNEKDRNLISQRIGRDLIGMKIPVGDVSPPAGFMTGKVYDTRKDLYNIFFQQVPADVCAGIEEALNLGEFYSVGLIWQGTLLGNITFALRKGQNLKNDPLIETYVRAASISLQRHVAENALKESENLYRTVIENIQDVFYRSDSEGNLIMASPSWASLLGYSSVEECLGHNIARDFYLEPEKRNEFLHAITTKGSVSDYEVVLKKKDKTPLYVSTTSHLYRNKDGIVLGVEGIFRDITERKKAEQTHRLLSSIVESTGDAVIGKDCRGTVISWNRAAEKLYGYLLDEMIGHHISQIIPPHKRQEMEEIFKRIELGESVNNLETQRVRKDGREVDVSMTISPITDDAGIVIGASTIARDITPHKAEERLRENEERYRILVENIAVGIYRSTGDPKGRFIWGNSSLVKILGYPSFDKLRQIGVADIFVEHDGRKRLLADLREQGFVKNREIALRRADGETISVLVTALARFDAKGDLTCINGIVEDITRQRQAESRVQSAIKERQDIIAFIPDPMVIVDGGNAVVAWNTAMEQLTGVQEAEVIGKKNYAHLFHFYDPACPFLFELFDANNEDLEGYYPGAYREGTAIVVPVRDPMQPDSPLGCYTIRASPLSDSKGNRIGAMGIIRIAGSGDGEILSNLSRDTPLPVTPVIAADLQLNNPGLAPDAARSSGITNLMYLSNALKNAREGIAIVDLSLHCIWTNDALIALLGTGSSDVVIGKSVAQYVASEFKKPVLDYFSEMKNHRRGGIIPLSLLTTKGRVPVEASVSIVSDDRDTTLGYMVIMKSIGWNNANAGTDQAGNFSKRKNRKGTSSRPGI